MCERHIHGVISSINKSLWHLSESFVVVTIYSRLVNTRTQSTLNLHIRLPIAGYKKMTNGSKTCWHVACGLDEYTTPIPPWLGWIDHTGALISGFEYCITIRVIIMKIYMWSVSAIVIYFLYIPTTLFNICVYEFSCIIISIHV
jgi:hypothetical protein